MMQDDAGSQGLTMTFLGCGTMGVAILSGILAAQSKNTETNASQPAQDLPSRLPTKFIACVNRPASKGRIEDAFAAYPTKVTPLVADNVSGVKQADVVLLGCKPWMYRDILGANGMKEALRGKLLISILAGVTVDSIEEHLYGTISTGDPENEGRCRIVRAMPNTAAAVRESMTVIATSNPPLASQQALLVTWIFERIGRVSHMPPNTLDACTALCGSGPAFMALVLEAAADGAVAMGVPRAEAQMMAAQVMRGTTGIVLNGEHPAILRDKVSTPGGCTIGGLLKLEEGGVRGSVARAVREATVVASELGKGKQGVNGTRF